MHPLVYTHAQYRRSIEEIAEDLAAVAVRVKAVQQRAGGSSTRVSSDADVTRLLGAIGRGQEASPGTTVDASPAGMCLCVCACVCVCVCVCVCCLCMRMQSQLVGYAT